MKCKNAQEFISQYYDKQLSKNDWRKLKSHLADCDKCLELYQKMASLNSRVKALQFPFKPTTVLETKRTSPALKVLVASGSVVGIIAALIIGFSSITPKTQNLSERPASIATDLTNKSSNYAGGNASGISPDTSNPSNKAEDERTVDNKTNKANNLQLVQDISLTLRVKNINATIKKITELTENNGGYVANLDVVQSAEQLREETIITLKVPVDKLKEVKANIREFGHVLAEKVMTEDVTLAIVDLEANLRNYRRQETRYLELIDKASKIADLEMLEQKLTEIRQNIEATQGQLQYQKSRVAMATLTINLVKKNKPKIEENWFVMMFSNAWQVFVGASSALINLLFGLLPFVIVGLIGYGAYRFVRKR